VRHDRAQRTLADGVVSTSFELVEVARGVYAYLQAPAEWGVNNVGIVHDGDRVLLVDTTQTPTRTARLAGALASVTPGPVRTIVNTHHHGDHTFGNYLFPDAAIVGHRRCRDEMIQRGLDSVVFPDQAQRLAEVRVEPPTIVFDDRIDIVVGEIACIVRHFEPAAHTTNDVVVLLPDHGVLFAGDLAFNGSTPFALAGSVAGSIRVCDELARFDVETVVPGHGPISTPAVFATVAEYYRLVEQVADDALSTGRDALTAARTADLGRFATWIAPERLVANVAVSMAEKSSAHPLNAAQAVRDMIAYNGGRPLEHPHD
jgi:cyclase